LRYCGFYGLPLVININDVLNCLVKELGADVNQAQETGATALIMAAQEGHANILQVLVEELGADINQADTEVCSPMLWAASKGRLSIVRTLLKLRANVNQADNNRVTPLMSASFHKHAAVVKFLVKVGADTQAVTKEIAGTADTAAFYSRDAGASAEQTAYLEAKTHCSNTGCSGAGIMTCPRCKQARYCQQACGEAHWKAHKADCKRWSAELEAGKGQGGK
jgi:ankyrin repeat protein